jgi:hypothetical protein
MNDKEQLARQRFMLLNIMRFMGVGIVLLAVIFISGRIFPAVPDTAGYVLLVVGMIDFFLMPAVLKKGWARQDGKLG